MTRPIRSVIPTAAISMALPVAAPPAGRTAPAQVFYPNPVQSLRDESLTDQKDTDFFSADPTLRKAYKAVALPGLDGSGTLTGTYAKVLSSTGHAATAGPNGFVYTRDDDRF